jgi:hypothetical protein
MEAVSSRGIFLTTECGCLVEEFSTKSTWHLCNFPPWPRPFYNRFSNIGFPMRDGLEFFPVPDLATSQ